MHGSRRETLGMWLGFLGVAIFAGTLPATRLAVAGLHPFFITAGRAAAAGVLALAVLLVLRRPWPRAHLRTLLLVAVMLTAGFPALMAFSLQTVPAAHGAVVLGILPLTTAAAASLLLGERPSWRFWICAIAGTVIVVAFALRDSGGTAAIGDMYMFLAALCASVGYVYSGRLARGMPGWEVICWVLVVALPATLPVTLWVAPADLGSVPASAWMGFAYVALFSMFIGFFAWNAGLAMGGVARVSQVQLLQTFITLGLATVINGERLDLATILVAVVVVVIVALGSKARVAR